MCHESPSGPCGIIPSGYYPSTNSSLCIPCPPGQYGGGSFGTCFQCPSGKFSNPGETYCSSCDAGKFWEIGSVSSCRDCMEGKFGLGVSSSCFDCPQDSWSNLTGKSSCFSCPQYPGVQCPSGSVVPWVGEGYFRKLNDPVNIAVCFPTEACLEAGFNETQCSLGYCDGLCAHCSSEFFRYSGKCVKCLAKAARWSIMVISVLIFSGVMMKVSVDQKNISPSLRMMLFWFQFLSLLPALSSSWPDVLISVFRFTSVFNFDIGYLGLSCDVSEESYFSLLEFKILLPVIFMALLFLVNAVLVCFKVISEFRLNRLLSQSIFVTNFFAVQLMSSMLQVFNCLDAGNGKFVIQQSPSIQCFSTNWNRFLVFDGFFLVLYILVLPTLVLLLYRASKKKQDIFDNFIRPLTANVRVGKEWIELVKFFFKLAFVLSRDTFRVSSSFKVCCWGVLLMFLIWIESRARPYESQFQNDLSLMWLMMCVSVLLSNEVFVANGAQVTESVVLAVVLVTFLVIVSLISTAEAMAFVVRNKKSGSLQSAPMHLTSVGDTGVVWKTDSTAPTTQTVGTV
eukprot:TRINITY_DN24789_c0_g1_i1.p1 TRINITY_DN24789_c0_g1~~TRINITY_DN24789_c0_g1_i1.p1  ORF type:complete len:614 (-),score=102.05 TRINITY_DN24789_c0_g1_i1:44-1738(-)